MSDTIVVSTPGDLDFVRSIPVTETTSHLPLPQPPYGFGQYFSDHIAVMDYDEVNGWGSPRVVPFASIPLHPAAAAFQYSQSIFDALKAHRQPDGSLQIFRPHAHIERLNRSARRMCIPEVDPATVLAMLKRLCDLDRRWAPQDPGSALYMRPTIIATEGYVSLRPAKRFTLLIFLSPVGDYFAEGNNPVRILASDQYVRAARGGVGSAKTGGNYAAALYASSLAQQEGFSQILWLDGVERRYLEEVGSMNIFVKIGGQVRTPPLSDSILAGITRDTILTLLREDGADVAETPIAIDELFAAQEAGTLEEVWGTGTAVIVSPVGQIVFRGKELTVRDGKRGPTAGRLFDQLVGIQKGHLPDPFGWRVDVPELMGSKFSA